MPRRRSIGTTAAVVMSALALLVSLGGTAFGGGDLFNDIAGSPFQDQINRIGRTGCASGFADGSFRRLDNVTRQQFAFWTNNCGGRAAGDEGGPLVLTTSGEQELADTTLIGGGTVNPGVSEGGFILAFGTLHASVSTDVAQCPCEVQAWLDDGTNTSEVRTATLLGVPDSDGEASVALSVIGAAAVLPEAPEHVRLMVDYEDNQSPDITFAGELLVLWVPFGADGDRASDAGD
jgi:hypothetical protein